MYLIWVTGVIKKSGVFFFVLFVVVLFCLFVYILLIYFFQFGETALVQYTSLISCKSTNSDHQFQLI